MIGVGTLAYSSNKNLKRKGLDSIKSLADRWVQRALAGCDLSAMPAGLAERVRSSGPLSEAQQYRVAEWASEYFGQYAGYANQYLFHWVEPHKERVGSKRACPICVSDQSEDI